jgi:hypothetical protein
MLSAAIFAWNVVLVNEIARRERYRSMLETDADARLELFKVLSMELHLHAVAPMKVRAVINMTRFIH